MAAKIRGKAPQPREFGGSRTFGPSMPIALLLASACGGDKGTQGAKLEGTTPAERYTSLASAKGCTPPASLPDMTKRCEVLFVDWIDCVASDLEQCICERSGKLNCEGSFKPNEGPALCIAEMDAFEMEGCDPD
jgi:hypothetical protein